MVPPPFFGSPPKAYYAHPALLGTLCQNLGSIGREVFEKNGNKQTDRQTNIYLENRRPYRISNIAIEIEYRIGGLTTKMTTFTLPSTHFKLQILFSKDIA